MESHQYLMCDEVDMVCLQMGTHVIIVAYRLLFVEGVGSISYTW